MQRVLIVDDDPDIRTMLRLLLEQEGYDIEAVNDGVAALEWLTRADEAWIVLMDINMPRMTGLEVCARLAAADELARRHIVVLMTAGLFPDDDMPPPVRALLRKPFDLDALLDLLTSLSSERPEGDDDPPPGVALSASSALDEQRRWVARYVGFEREHPMPTLPHAVPFAMTARSHQEMGAL
ncbi:MAG TPA: response regulator [Ktedonobacterales bacterium]|nr:response regulator [Ktedonobacterales bacterium]